MIRSTSSLVLVIAAAFALTGCSVLIEPAPVRTGTPSFGSYLSSVGVATTLDPGVDEVVLTISAAPDCSFVPVELTRVDDATLRLSYSADGPRSGVTPCLSQAGVHKTLALSIPDGVDPAAVISIDVGELGRIDFD